MNMQLSRPEETAALENTIPTLNSWAEMQTVSRGAHCIMVGKQNRPR